MTKLIGRTVVLVRGAAPATDLVVAAVHPYQQRPEPWTAYPSALYELHWPDGGATWHARHEFEPIGGNL